MANSDDLTAVPASAGDPYRLRHDYWTNLSRDLPLELTKRLLARVYFSFDSVGDLNRRPTVDFNAATRNLTPDAIARLGDPTAPDATRQRDVPNSNHYWSIMGLTAFDPFVLQSCDPCGKLQLDGTTRSFGTQGQTVGGGGSAVSQDVGQPVFSVFLETIRDRREGQPPNLAACSNSFENMLETVTAHEILARSIGLGSTTNTLTDEHGVAAMTCSGDPRVRQLTDEQLAALRRTIAPQVNPD